MSPLPLFILNSQHHLSVAGQRVYFTQGRVQSSGYVSTVLKPYNYNTPSNQPALCCSETYARWAKTTIPGSNYAFKQYSWSPNVFSDPPTADQDQNEQVGFHIGAYAPYYNSFALDFNGNPEVTGNVGRINGPQASECKPPLIINNKQAKPNMLADANDVIVKNGVEDITVQNNSINSITFYFTDIAGKVYFTNTLLKNTNFVLDKNKYVPGIYFINYNNGYKNVNNKVLIN